MKLSKIVPILFVIALFLGSSLTDVTFAKGRGGGSRSTYTSYRSSSSHSRSSYSTSRSSYSSKAPSSYSRSTYSAAARDSHGHIQRSDTARHQFMKQTGYSKGRPGYVIDHIVPLKRGGVDRPSNMQWQTNAVAKEKDRWE
jgi:hypothetical protein